jgi:hypothetical protein
VSRKVAACLLVSSIFPAINLTNCVLVIVAIDIFSLELIFFRKYNVLTRTGAAATAILAGFLGSNVPNPAFKAAHATLAHVSEAAKICARLGQLHPDASVWVVLHELQ